jgi:WD40 repeat protein
MTSEGVERAAAAVFVNGRRRGSCALVDRRHALTAQHVVGTQCSAGTEVELHFPAVGARVQAVSVDIGTWARATDVALLALAGELPTGVAVPEWLPYAGATDRVALFGYPLEERELNGIWVQATPAGLTAAGILQIDATGAASSLRGHSGGPVMDATTGAVIGVLVEGSAELRFDRAVPIELLARHCPGLVSWWMFAGDDTQDHFRRRATGQRSIVRGGDLFRGRAAALERIRGSIAADAEMPVVITGQPGAGKSAVLARAALTECERATNPGLAFHARGQGIGELARAVARVAAVPSPSRWQDLVDHLTQRLEGRLALFIDALDEMATDRDIAEAVGFLRELSRLAGVSVTVATRWRSPGAERRARDLPGRLGAIEGGSRDTLVDLDSDRYFDAGDLLAYAEDVMCQRDALRPGPGGAAWEEYRRDPGLRRRLSHAIARRAHRNYLVAAMSAFELSESDEPVDPARRGFHGSTLPGTVGEALTKYLDRLPEGRRQRTEHLLVALSYAEGSGLTDNRWGAFTEALGYARPSQEDLDALRSSGAADYLLQTTGGDSGRTTRLFHQALADHLREGRDARDDQRRLASCLVAELPAGDWSVTPDYLRQHGPAHLAAGGLLDEHLTDVRFLLAVHPEGLIRVLPEAASTAARLTAHVYDLAFHQLATRPAEERSAYLQLAARCAGQDALADALTDAVRTSSWSVVWAQSRPPHPHRVLGRHRGGVNAVPVGDLEGESVVVSGGDDGMVRVWHLDGGAAVGEPWCGHQGEVGAVALGDLDGESVVVSGGEDGTVRVWQLDSGAPVGDPWRGHQGPVQALVVGELAGESVMVSGGEDGTVQVWRLDGGIPVGDPWRGHEGRVSTLAMGRLEERPVVVSGGEDGTVRVWRLDGGSQVGEPWRGHDAPVMAVTVGHLDGQPVVVSGDVDGTLRMWWLDSGAPVGKPWRGHDSVNAVALGELAGRPVVVSSGVDDGTVRLWELDGAAPVGEPWRGHDAIRAVAAATLEDRLVVVSGGADGTVRAWRHDLAAPAGEPWSGHEGRVWSVAVGELEGYPVVVSGGADGTVRVWRLDTGAPVGEPWYGHTGPVWALAVGTLEGRDVVVSGGDDGTVRVWELDGGSPVGEPWCGHDGGVSAVAVGKLEGEPLVVSTGEDGTVRVWRLDGGAPVGEPWRGHDGVIHTAVVAELEGHPVVVSGGADGTVRVWQLNSGAPCGEPWRGHEGRVGAVAAAKLEGRPIVVSGGWDRTVRIWGFEDGGAVGDPWHGHEGGVWAVAVGELDGRPVLLSGAWDGTVGIWQPADGSRQVVDLGSSVQALAFASPGQMIVGTAMGIVVLRLGRTSTGEGRR